MKPRHGLLAGLARHFVEELAASLEAEQLAARAGLLQALDPRAKLLAIILLIVGASTARLLLPLAGLFVLAVVLALLSQIPLASLARRVWLTVALFTGLIALPALVLVPGEVIVTLPWGGLGVSHQGLRSAAFLVGRGETCVTLVSLLVMTTPWQQVLKAMRSLGVPVVVVAMLGMTQRYIFLLVQLALQMFEARRSRVIIAPDAAATRRMALAMLGVLLGKSLQLAGEVHQAMLARGYRGEVCLLDEFQMRWCDWLVLLLASAICVVMVLLK
jgi:cobalt/nickel transport system permease protein